MKKYFVFETKQSKWKKKQFESEQFRLILPKYFYAQYLLGSTAGICINTWINYLCKQLNIWASCICYEWDSAENKTVWQELTVWFKFKMNWLNDSLKCVTDWLNRKILWLKFYPFFIIFINRYLEYLLWSLILPFWISLFGFLIEKRISIQRYSKW